MADWRDEYRQQIEDCRKRTGRQLHRYRGKIAALKAEVKRLRAAPPRIVFRPLLTSGMYAGSEAGRLILIDSEQPESEQLIALWHETLHLLGLRDDDLVEPMARRLAAACPELLQAIKENNRPCE